MIETDYIEARPSIYDQLTYLHLNNDAYTSTSANLSLLLYHWQRDLTGIPVSSRGDRLS